MKLPKDDFKKLQQEWYQRLKELGFKDIERVEGDELVLINSATSCFRSVDEFTRNIKAEYFRCMAVAAQDEATVYRNDVDRHILIRYVEGAKIKTICSELRALGTPRDRNSIRFIIRRYEMQWGFRHYNARQLHIKITA